MEHTIQAAPKIKKIKLDFKESKYATVEEKDQLLKFG